jgi:ketosteroid isomerase-like protein
MTQGGAVTATTSIAQQNRELVLGALAAITTGDTETFLEAMHPDVVVHEPSYLPYGGDYVGAEGFLDLLPKASSLIDLSGVQLVSATADEDRTVLLMTAPLVSNGETVHITEHWQVRDGKVVDVRVFWYALP